MQNYTRKNVSGIDCYINSELAEVMAFSAGTTYMVECEIEALKIGIDPDDLSFETGEFKVETGFINNKRYVLEGEVVFQGKDEEGNPESWKLDESKGVQIRRVR